jgi:hypothetical protein
MLSYTVFPSMANDPTSMPASVIRPNSRRTDCAVGKKPPIFLLGWLVSTLLCLTIGLASSGSPMLPKIPRNSGKVPGRALWVWNPAFLENEAKSGSFLDFVCSRHISTLFLFVSSKRFEGMEGGHRAFLRLAHARGLRVDAMNGEPEWLYPERQAKPATFIDQIIRFNSTHAPDERFDGIHLDVEPQALMDWKKGKRGKIIRQYLEFLNWCRGKAQSGGVSLAVDIPVGFERIKVGSTNLAFKVTDLVDEIALMAYQGRAQRIIEVARPLIEAGNVRGKRVWVGVSPEPGRAGGTEPDRLSKSEFEDIVHQVEKANGEHPSFVGVAIHDYRRYRKLFVKTDR